MTEAQRRAVLDRDMNRMIALGGNICFLAKIGATDGPRRRRTSGAVGSHCPECHPGRRRPHDRQPARCRPRSHGAADPDGRPTRLLAVPGDPDRGQRRAVSGVVRPSMFPARAGHPSCDRHVRRPDRRPDLGNRRHEPSAPGPRAGLINSEFDGAFLDQLVADPVRLADKPHIDHVREAGSEGIELVMWLIARGAMSDVVARGRAPTVRHRFYHVSASNTAVGHLILEEPD